MELDGLTFIEEVSMRYLVGVVGLDPLWLEKVTTPKSAEPCQRKIKNKQ